MPLNFQKHVLKCELCGADLWIPWDEEYTSRDNAAAKFLGGGAFSHPAPNGEFGCSTVCECGKHYLIKYDFISIKKRIDDMSTDEELREAGIDPEECK